MQARILHRNISADVFVQAFFFLRGGRVFATVAGGSFAKRKPQAAWDVLDDKTKSANFVSKGAHGDRRKNYVGFTTILFLERGSASVSPPFVQDEEGTTTGIVHHYC